MTVDVSWPHDDVLHAWWVEPGALLAGEYPASKNPRLTRTKLQLLVDAGINSIVDLTTDDDGLAPYAEALTELTAQLGRSVTHYLHPILDFGVTDDAGYDRIVARIRDETSAGHRVYLHCVSGVGRTCTVVGCLLGELGLGYEAVMTRIAELRRGTRKAQRRGPESQAQREYLRIRLAKRT